MSRNRPAATCREMSFAVPCALTSVSQVALEDYARAVAGATAAEIVELAPGEVSGIHFCGLSADLLPNVERDVSDFAQELAAEVPGGGLGWS